MWKNRFQRKSNENDEDLTRTGNNSGTAKGETRPASPLPSKQDRLALFRLLESVVEQRCVSYSTLTDPRSLGVKAFFLGKNVPAITSFGIRKRQLDYLRLHMLPTLAAALLLGIQDIQTEESLTGNTHETVPSTVIDETSSAGIQSSTAEEPLAAKPLVLPTLEDPVACIALLISNMVLVSKGNYDSRVRSVLKTACVPLLEELIPRDEIEDQNKARALYFLTEEHTKKEKPPTPLKKKFSMDDSSQEIQEEQQQQQTPPPLEEPEPEIDWERTTRIPKLTRSRVATQQFEAIERAIATDILKELVERDQAAMQHATKANTWKDHVVRGLQITTMGVVVGSLFAVTGGLAAPGLVAAITALGVHSTAVFAALTTTTALASMFGALGGGLGAYKMSKRVRGISEWRIRQETTTTTESHSKQGNDAIHLRGLHAHVCVSGWLVEKCDFQRPFGVKCHDPPLPPLRALQRFFCVHVPERVKDAETMLKETEQEELWPQLKEEYGQTPDDLLPLEGEAALVLSHDCCVGINNVLIDHVLPESAVGKMKETWEMNTMLIQMLAKNDELQGKASVIPDDVYTDEEENEMMEALKEEAMRVASTSNSTYDKDEGQGESADGEMNDYSTEQITAAPDEGDESPAHVIRKGTGDNTVGGTNEVKVDVPSKEDSQRGEEDSIQKSEPEISTGADVAPTIAADEGLRSVHAADAAENLDTGISDALKPEEEEAPSNAKVTEAEEKRMEEIEEKAAKAEGMNNHLEIIWDWQATYSGELYTLTWETDFLLKLCRVATVLFLEISDTVGKQILLNALVGSVVAIPSALWTASIVIDDPYQLISLRSKKAGIELAHCLLTSDEHRPISLVGFSFGARLIFDCLLEIARHQLLWQEEQARQENADDNSESRKRGLRFMRRRRSHDEDKIDYVREPASIIEDVVLIGMPRILDRGEWITCREMVGGRLVNCFNRKDWIVSYMINVRCFNAVSKTCGTHEVPVEGVENFEVSEFASTHDRYLAAVPQILGFVGYSQPQPGS